MNNELLLLSGADIPFIEGTITIHQPTVYEISLIGEEAFFAGCELLKFSKDILTDKDKTKLFNYSDFNILLSIINDKSGSMSHDVSCALLVLQLMFPQYEIDIQQYEIVFRELDYRNICGRLNDANFQAFKDILISMFCLNNKDIAAEYNAQGDLAKSIANKFKKRKQQLADLNPKPNKVAIFSRYISILAVGEHKDINSFMKYTVYQLFDEFQRFELKTAYDIHLKAQLAGAKDLKEPEDWMKDIHS